MILFADFCQQADCYYPRNDYIVITITVKIFIIIQLYSTNSDIRLAVSVQCIVPEKCSLRTPSFALNASMIY